MSPVSFAAVSPHEAAPVPPKLRHAAQQFEALLLNDLLGPVEKAFSSIPGKSNEPGASDYQYLGTQALAAHIAASGGLGIGAMIIRNLMKRQEMKGHPETAKLAKVTPAGSR